MASPTTYLCLMEVEMLRGRILELEMQANEHNRRETEDKARHFEEAERREKEMETRYREKIDKLEEKLEAKQLKNKHLVDNCVRLMVENDALKRENTKTTVEMKKIETTENGEAARKLLEEEQKKTSEYRKKMLCAQMKLREKQEDVEGDVKPWRLCNICLEEFSHVPEHTPKVLHCGHTLCFSCCNRICMAYGIACPFCQKLFIMDKEEIVNLPTNFIVLHM
ncbi:unnamed protein product [Caenorhabditis nigoni]